MDLEIIKIAEKSINNRPIKNHTHFSKLKNHLCGDEMHISLIIKNGKIINFGYEGKSCIYCQASASLLSEVSINQKKLKIDGIVCNVGGGSNPKNGEENIKNYEVNFQKNFFSSINIIYGLKKLFKKNAKIVCISSIASKSIVDTPIAYSVAKAALNSFVVNFAKNFKINKICITGILPGHVMHQNSVWMKKKKINPKLVNLLIDRHIPSGEWIKPKDISELTYFLLSHSSNSFNGTLIDLEGGVTTK